MRTLGQKPTLAEMLAYYDRADVRSFIYHACLGRKISMFFAAEPRWAESLRDNFLTLESPEHLRETIISTYRDALGELAEDEPMKVYPSFHATVDMLDDYKDFVLEPDQRDGENPYADQVLLYETRGTPERQKQARKSIGTGSLDGMRIIMVDGGALPWFEE